MFGVMEMSYVLTIVVVTQQHASVKIHSTVRLKGVRFPGFPLIYAT